MRAEVGEAYEASTAPTRALQKAKGQRLSLRRALDEFREALAGPPEEGGPERFVPLLEHLRVVFAVHVEVTESPGGLYEEILEIAPRLANKIARFRREHTAIVAALQSALDDLGDGRAVLAADLRAGRRARGSQSPPAPSAACCRGRSGPGGRTRPARRR